MIRRFAFLLASGIALGGPALAQNVDQVIAARGNDPALKSCLDRSPAVAGYRTAVQSASKARDPKSAAKFNCSGIGASWQEVAPRACCAAFGRDKGKNVDAAWTALQVCGWQAKTAERRPSYEAAARQCLAQTAAKPAPQQAQKPQTPAPTPKAPAQPQQAQKPQPTTPSRPTFESHRQPTPPVFPPYQPQAPAAPVYPQQQAQVPLAPPPPLVPPVKPVDQAPKAADQTERYLRAIEESLGIRPGLLVMAESLHGSAGYVMYLDDKKAPWVVDTFGIHKPMFDWAQQRIHGEQFYLLTDKSLEDELIKRLPDLGAGATKILWAKDYSKASLQAAAQKGQRQLQQGLSEKEYVAFRAYGMDNAIVSNRFVRAPTPPPGTNLQIYYYLWRRAFNLGPGDWIPTTWDLARGINGGGDFIELQPPSGKTQPTVHVAGRWINPLVASGATPVTTGQRQPDRDTSLRIELTSGSVDLLGFAGLIDVSDAGVSLIAVTQGSVVAREHATGMTTTAGLGSAIAIVPGIGIAQTQMSDDLYARVVASQKSLPPIPRTSATAVKQDAPSISAVATALGVKDGKPVIPTTVFKPDAKEIFVWFRLSGITAPVKLRGVWNYVAPDGDQFIVESEATVRPENQWGDFRIEGPPGRPWPTGQYRVDLYLAGRKTASVPFRVEDAVAHPTIVATRAARGVKNGEPVGVSDAFPPDAGTLYAWFRIAGHKEPVKLRGEWHYLGGGGDRMVIASDLTVQPKESWGDFQFELPPGRPWPLGAYRVDILMGGKVAASVPFRVEQPAAKPAPATPTAEAAPTLTISGAQVARGVKDGKPVDPGAVFAPTASPLYVWFRVAGITASVKLRGEWHYLGDGKDRIVSQTEGELKAGMTSANFRRTLSEGKTWASGEYRFDIFAADALAASVRFRIEEPDTKPAAQAQAAAGITVANVEALLRELGVDPQQKTRKDGVPYFIFTIDGRKTVLALYGCTPGPCAQALLHTGFQVDKKVAPQAINEWNRDQRFVRAYLDKDGDPTVESDLVVSGAQLATVREWIATWRRQVPQFMAHVTK